MDSNIDKENFFPDEIPSFEDELSKITSEELPNIPEESFHSKIAEIIKGILEKSPSLTKRTIALFGRWGSGKSTILEILKKKYGPEAEGKNTDNKSKNGNNQAEHKISIEVVTFDTWEYATETNLKRFFLLELAEKLELSESRYKEDKTSISQKKEKEKKQEAEETFPIRDYLENKIVWKSTRESKKISIFWLTSFLISVYIIYLFFPSFLSNFFW